MDHSEELEAQFLQYWANLPSFLPDGMIEVDLQLLQELDLLHTEATPVENDVLSQNFYVMESHEKLTLFNDDFTIWIIPKVFQETPTTYTLIARKDSLSRKTTQLEVAFSTTGVYNQSGLVLRILERFLEEISDTEKEIIPYSDQV